MGPNKGARGARQPKAGARAVSLAGVAAVVLVLFIALFAMLLGTAPAKAYSPQPVGAPIEPNPGIEGNATITPFLASYSPITYGNSIGSTSTLPAHIDPRVKAPFVVTPTDVIAPGILTANAVQGAIWNKTAQWTALGTSHGQTSALSQTTVNGQQVIQYTENTTNSGGSTSNSAFSNNFNYSSTNLAFDWITIEYSLSGGGATCNGNVCYLEPYMQNAAASSIQLATYNSANGTVTETGVSGAAVMKIYTGTTAFLTFSLANLQVGSTSFSSGTTLKLGFQLFLPQAASVTLTAQILGVNIGTSPLTLGPSPWGATTKVIQSWNGINANLTAFTPTFTYTQVVASGYQVAIIQAGSDVANATATASAVSLNNATSGGAPYVEQITYTFGFGLPIAPSLSYSSFKLIDRVNISGAQYSSVSFGGTSYTTAYAGYGVCTSTCVGFGVYNSVQAAVTATTQQSWIGIVLFTGPQWDSISTAPGLFSPNGIQYIWYLFLAAILAVTGGILGVSGYVVKNRRALQVRKGWGHVPFLRVVEAFERYRALRRNRRGNMEARHLTMIVLGTVVGGAAAIALWSIFNGADTAGASASFIGGLIILLLVVGVAFVAYEVAHRVRHRHHSG